jgi:hypothetical protein
LFFRHIRAIFPFDPDLLKEEKHMNYPEFLHTLFDMLKEKAGPDTTLQYQQVSKNNGVNFDAIIMISSKVNLSPTIYIPPYYHRYLDGVSMEQIVEDIMTAYKTHLPEQDFDITLFTDYEKARDHIVLRLVSYERNEKLLQTVPHRRFLDFAVIFYCLLESNSSHQAGILIYNHHLCMWNVDCEELYQTAMHNSPRLLEYKLFNLQDILKEVLSEAENWDEEDLFPMYALSNRHRTYGAGVILYPGLLSELADSFGKDLLIIPSSVHEVLLLPSDEFPDTAYYSEMIREVNETQLADEEVLSDHPYYYSRKARMMTTAPIP